MEQPVPHHPTILQHIRQLPLRFVRTKVPIPELILRAAQRVRLREVRECAEQPIQILVCLKIARLRGELLELARLFRLIQLLLLPAEQLVQQQHILALTVHGVRLCPPQLLRLVLQNAVQAERVHKLMPAEPVRHIPQIQLPVGHLVLHPELVPVMPMEHGV